MDNRKILKRIVSVLPCQRFRHYLRDKLWLKSIPYTHYGTRYFKTAKEGNRLILETLRKGQPCLITRFGMTECKCVQFFLPRQDKVALKFPSGVWHKMEHNAGFFRPSNELLTKFCCDFLRLVPNIDILGILNYSEAEKQIMDDHNPQAELVNYGSIVGLFDDEPWMQYLEGKKVLVIHPFAEQIVSQYKNRKKLFKNPKILPDFDLKVIKTVQGIGETGEVDRYENWFEALESMYRQIDQTDFDIALIAAGAYGIFLGDYVKRQNKQAVHIGGALQLLFGIKGSRWNGSAIEKEFYNSYWVNVDSRYQPHSLKEFLKAEGNNAYW